MFYYETEFDYEQVIKLVGIQKNFRYFETRSREIFDSHVYHILLKDESCFITTYFLFYYCSLSY